MDVSSKSAIKNLYTKKLSLGDVKAIKNEIAQNVKEISLHVNEPSNSVDDTISKLIANFQDFQKFLESVGYDGKKSISDLSRENAERILQEMFKKVEYKKIDIKA